MPVSYKHDDRSAVLPAYDQKEVRLDSHHLLDAVAELVGPEHPGNGDGLEETDPEERHAAGRVVVHELENVDSALRQEHFDV